MRNGESAMQFNIKAQLIKIIYEFYRMKYSKKLHK